VMLLCYVTRSAERCRHVHGSGLFVIADGCTRVPVRKGTVRDRFGGEDWQPLVSTLRGLFDDLGLQRRSKTLPSLIEYLAARGDR
jgi:hypothetical protein